MTLTRNTRYVVSVNSNGSFPVSSLAALGPV